MDISDRTLRLGLISIGVYQLALGLFQVVAPGTFFEEIGPFGPQNDHYIRDGATWELAAGAALLAAASRPSWRLPVLALTVLHFALHTINHVVDVNEADPSWVGPADAIALAIGTVLLAGLMRAAHQREGRLT